MFSPVVKPGQHLKILGYQSKTGKKSAVRYSFYGQGVKLTSNAGQGLVLAKDADLASRDAMAVNTGSFQFVSKVALGDVVLKNEMDHIKDLQNTAIWQLGSKRFDYAKATKVLEEVSKKCPERAKEVKEALANIKSREKEG